MSSRAALLVALMVGPGHAAELAKRVDERTNGRVQIKDGALYPAMRDLELDQLIDLVSPEGVIGADNKLRRVWKLTKQGEKMATSVVASLRALIDG